MSWDQVSLADRDVLYERYQAKDHEAVRQAARTYAMTPKNVVRRLQEHRQYQIQYASSEITHRSWFTRTFNEAPVLDWDSVIITSDYEEPYADGLMKQLSLLMAVKYNVKQLIINGDFLATDQPGVSSHPPQNADALEVTYRQSVNVGALTLAEYLKWFTDILGTNGNHDDMINRVTGGQVDIGMLLEDRFGTRGYKYTPYAYAILETNRGPYLVAHPRQYRNNGTTLAQAVYNVYATPKQEKAHIILGHVHHWGSVKSPDNLRGCHSLGCMRGPHKAAYKDLNITTHHQWNYGFGMLLDSHFHNFDLGETDWVRWLKDLCPEAVWHRTLH